VSAPEQTGAGLLALMSPEEAHRYAMSLLGPVLRHDANGRGDLAVSLAEWLRRHGQWDPAAARLGVHRHTLRNRIAKVAELTGRDLDSPGTRAEFWFALQLLESGVTHSGKTPETPA
jgi:DNA-binding PucR family transcriptional regulator